MLHYHVWFDLKPEVTERGGLEIVYGFMNELVSDRRAVGFRILRNKGEGLKTKLPRYHALVEFADSAHLGAAMAGLRERGIGVGLHGEMMKSVSDFRVEVFEEIPLSSLVWCGAGDDRCEI